MIFQLMCGFDISLPRDKTAHRTFPEQNIRFTSLPVHSTHRIYILFTTRWNTVDSRYLEFQGTLWNTSRYPYLDISDLQNLGEKIRTTTFNKYWSVLLDSCQILKILRKRGEIAMEQFLLFSTIFFTYCHMFIFKQGPDFHFEISGYTR